MPPKLITVEWEEEEVFIRPPEPPTRIHLTRDGSYLYFDIRWRDDFGWLMLTSSGTPHTSESIRLFLE